MKKKHKEIRKLVKLLKKIEPCKIFLYPFGVITITENSLKIEENNEEFFNKQISD